MSHTLTKANFDAMLAGLEKESNMSLRLLASGANKTYMTSVTERNKRRAQLSAFLGYRISLENFDAAMQFVSFHAARILTTRST
jgi:hypothetical protein